MRLLLERSILFSARVRTADAVGMGGICPRPLAWPRCLWYSQWL